MSKNTKKNNTTKKVEKIESTEEKTDTIIDAKEMAVKVEESISEKQEKAEKKRLPLSHRKSITLAAPLSMSVFQ